MSLFYHAAAIARLRTEADVTQAQVAAESGIDQSRVSRIEKGEILTPTDRDRVLDALIALGSPEAQAYKEYAAREWKHIKPPLFWNPERASLEATEDILEEIDEFLRDDEHPWPLRRLIEGHRKSLLRKAHFLGLLEHNVAFIGDIGVGKSTAISFVFDLLLPPSIKARPAERPILETGAGRTTICEVHVKTGPEFGLSLLPMSNNELLHIVADFCTAKWSTYSGNHQGEERGMVSRELERAIRNMSGLLRSSKIIDGKRVYHDPIHDLIDTCSNEDEFRARLLKCIALENRTQRELWYDKSTQKDPIEWITETFKAVNNGRLEDVSLPKSIDLLIPNFGKNFGELEITVIDTKGVDDVSIREDLDRRLKDPRTAVILCSRFNDAPGATAQSLLKHMQETFAEPVDTGKVSILTLPRTGEALEAKNDAGEQVLSDDEGYEEKKMQVDMDLEGRGLSGIPVIFYNVETDSPEQTRSQLLCQLHQMRKNAEKTLSDLGEAVQDIIKNHEEKAINASIEEVAERLNNFFRGNKELGEREKLPYGAVIEHVKDVRYASTLWASTRRDGEYAGFNIIHLIGVGSAQDAYQRSQRWFNSLEDHLKALKADPGLALAARSIDQIAASAAEAKREFLGATQRWGVEVYRRPLVQASVWKDCVDEWGKGPGFKYRIAGHLESWFREKTDLKERLEEGLRRLWEQEVITPLLHLANEDPT